MKTQLSACCGAPLVDEVEGIYLHLFPLPEGRAEVYYKLSNETPQRCSVCGKEYSKDTLGEADTIELTPEQVTRILGGNMAVANGIPNADVLLYYAGFSFTTDEDLEKAILDYLEQGAEPSHAFLITSGVGSMVIPIAVDWVAIVDTEKRKEVFVIYNRTGKLASEIEEEVWAALC